MIDIAINIIQFFFICKIQNIYFIIPQRMFYVILSFKSFRILCYRFLKYVKYNLTRLIKNIMPNKMYLSADNSQKKNIFLSLKIITFLYKIYSIPE